MRRSSYSQYTMFCPFPVITSIFSGTHSRHGFSVEERIRCWYGVHFHVEQIHRTERKCERKKKRGREGGEKREEKEREKEGDKGRREGGERKVERGAKDESKRT